MGAYRIDEEGRMVMSFDEYMKVVTVCERIYDNQVNSGCMDTKLHFTQYDAWPTVEELERHKVRDNFEKYFKYLVFYAEVYSSDSARFKKTEKYIRDLMNEKLVIVE